MAKISKKIFSSTQSTNTGELSTVYYFYVIYECILINIIGFVTLFFQCELQSIEYKFENKYGPQMNITQWEWDSLFGHYWLKHDLNCNTRAAHCSTYMIAGWLMIASVLQAFVNFDGLRQKLFPKTNNNVILPKSIKMICMYAFFVCDWYWVVLMYVFKDVVGWQQAIGSAVDIAIRLVFVMKPSLVTLS
eukprot:TCONS_00001634-protein